MRHCPECRGVFPSRYDVCPTCWCALSPGPARRTGGLVLVFASGALFEADLVEGVLWAEGIPCLRLPGQAAWLAWPPAGTPAQSGYRLYVRAEVAPLAAELVSEVAGGHPAEG